MLSYYISYMQLSKSAVYTLDYNYFISFAQFFCDNKIITKARKSNAAMNLHLGTLSLINKIFLSVIFLQPPVLVPQTPRAQALQTHQTRWTMWGNLPTGLPNSESHDPRKPELSVRHILMSGEKLGFNFHKNVLEGQRARKN